MLAVSGGRRTLPRVFLDVTPGMMDYPV